MLDATVGPDEGDPATKASAGRIPPSYRAALQRDGLKGARLGMLTALFGSAPEDGEAADVVRRAVDQIKKDGADVIDVAVPGLEELLRDSGVIDAEFKFDFAEYLARHPGAPVRSLGDILERGLYDESMEARLTRRNNLEKRDTDGYRRALVKRDALRHAVVSTLEEHRLVALLYPTMRRKPARIGEAQGGTNCSLSANSGLPALSVPAGFTDDGLPIGIELLGREFSEADLLKIGYAWEQSAKLRRPPFSTPPLVEGQAPPPVAFEARSSGLLARLSYDPVTSELSYDVRLSGFAAAHVLAVTIQRGEPERPHGVVARLVEAGAVRASGVVTLGHRDREDLRAGRLFLRAYTRQQPFGMPPARIAAVSSR
jgi:hypothetical protein